MSSENVYTSSSTPYAAGGEVRKKVATVTCISHIEGETVQIFADEAVQPGKTVAGSSITLESAAFQVHVGPPYTRKFKSLKLAFGTRDGTVIGKPKNG